MGERGGAQDPQARSKISCARCVPDRPVIRGMSRSPTDSEVPFLTWAYAAHSTAGDVLPSNRSCNDGVAKGLEMNDTLNRACWSG